jgi:hypothetical protein
MRRVATVLGWIALTGAGGLVLMFRSNRGLWLVTVASTVLLLGSMGIAMRKGVG